MILKFIQGDTRTADNDRYSFLIKVSSKSTSGLINLVFYVWIIWKEQVLASQLAIIDSEIKSIRISILELVSALRFQVWSEIFRLPRSGSWTDFTVRGNWRYNSSGTASSRLDDHLIYPVLVHVHNLKAKIIPYKSVSGRWNSPQMHHHKPSNGLVVTAIFSW